MLVGLCLVLIVFIVIAEPIQDWLFDRREKKKKDRHDQPGNG